MAWYSRTLAGVFPDYALRRLRAMQMVNAYEAASPTRLHKAKRESRGPNSPVASAAKSLREQARDLEQNSPLANSVLDVLVANTVGLGIKPEAQVLDKQGNLHEEANDLLTTLYMEWARKPEVTWQHDECSAQRLCARSMFRDGEVFLKHLTGNIGTLDHGTDVPYSYEMVEADFCPFDYTDAKINVRNGISVNQWGRPTVYNLYKSHPNDLVSLTGGNFDTVAVPASNIQHLKVVKRIGQMRGVSVFAAIMRTMADLNEIDNAEVVAAKIAAFMAMAIKKGEPMLYQAPANGEEYRQFDFQPGMVIDDLMPGESVEMIDSSRPNNEIIPFREMLMRNVAGGSGAGNSSVSKNYNGTYSAQRQEMMEQRMMYLPIWSYFVERSERPKRERFIQAAQARGLLTPILKDIDTKTLDDAAYSMPQVPWVDPLKEAKSWRELVDGKLASQEEIIRMRGKDPREVRRQIARETAAEPTQPEVPNGDQE